MRVTLFVIAAVAAGCGGSTELTGVDLPVRASAGATSFAVEDWAVSLDEAKLGFGPLYLCASVSASPELCAVAVAELAEVVTVDLAPGEPRPIGRLRGVSDTVHSALYDYGITWRSGANARPAPDALAGHSVVLRGTARRGSEVLPFDLRVDVPPIQPGSYAVLARIAEHRLTAHSALTLRFEPAAWFAEVDFAAPTSLANAIATALGSSARPAFLWTDAP